MTTLATRAFIVNKVRKKYLCHQNKNCNLMSVVFSLFVELAAALCALDHFYLLDNNQYSVELLTENGAFFKVAKNTFNIKWAGFLLH